VGGTSSSSVGLYAPNVVGPANEVDANGEIISECGYIVGGTSSSSVGLYAPNVVVPANEVDAASLELHAPRPEFYSSVRSFDDASNALEVPSNTGNTGEYIKVSTARASAEEVFGFLLPDQGDHF
jgi:hypothetical protein